MASRFFDSQPKSGEIEEKMQGFPSWLEISLDSISRNLEKIKKAVKGAELIPCVKTNAYGHGLVPIVAHMMRRGIKRVLVAKLWEAMQLREAGLDCDIINMDPVFTDIACEKIVEKGITQTVFNMATAEKISSSAVKLGKDAKVFIKIDTGLGRVGVKHDEAPSLIESICSLPKISLEGIFSTLSEDRAYDRVQLERMLYVEAELRKRGLDPGTRSMASSNAVFHFPDSYLDAVRPGLMVYGVYPEEEDREAGLSLEQALSFKARLEHVKWVEKGESLTYSRRFIAPRRMRVGTIHVGYSDGYPRGLTNKGIVKVGGVFKPVLGTVSLNHHLIELDETGAETGDIVELIGREREINISNLARLAGIMTYTLCVGLNPLLPRVYYEKGRPVAVSEPKIVES
ncbi:alanine racemase [Candidatus Bathyarchaeota archaeon]|nr:alanine racemase [Candidatus Bathyarchaeota archaeon]